MDNPKPDQSFSVDDIRKHRESEDRRYGDMTMEEIITDIHKQAEKGRAAMAARKYQREAGGHGDYTAERDQLLEGITMEDILAEIPREERE